LYPFLIDDLNTLLGSVKTRVILINICMY